MIAILDASWAVADLRQDIASSRSRPGAASLGLDARKSSEASAALSSLPSYAKASAAIERLNAAMREWPRTATATQSAAIHWRGAASLSNGSAAQAEQLAQASDDLHVASHVIADEAGSILDPAAETYYLADLLANRYPDFLDSLDYATGAAPALVDLARSGSWSPTAAATARQLSHALSRDWQALSQSIALSGGQATDAAGITQAAMDAGVASDQLSALLSALPKLDANGPDIPLLVRKASAEHRRVATAVIAPALQLRLSARLRSLRARQGAHAGIALAILGLFAWMTLSAEGFRRAARSEIEQKIETERMLDTIAEASAAELNDTIHVLRSTQEEGLRKAKLATLGSMVAGVAHEINTPIGNMLLSQSSFMHKLQQAQQAWSAGSLKKSDLDRFFELAIRTSTVTIDACERCAKLVSSFKQVASDQVSEVTRPFDLSLVARQTLDSFTPTLTSQAVHVVADLQGAAECHCVGRPGLVSQALTILLHNAALHAFPGRAEGQLTLHISVSQSRQGHAQVVVADNGVGMLPEVLDHVFDPFFSTKHGEGGTGIGLAIARQIAESMGGELTAKSALGHGSTFTLSFPRLPDEVVALDLD